MTPVPADADRTPVPVRSRIESVDALRGIVMIIMALDHTRDYFGAAAVNPTDMATTTVPLFFTRWITHICAPVFFFLAGTGAFLAMRRRTSAQLSRFLLTRGLWFVLLELTVMRFILQFNVDYRVTILTILWAMGWCMVILSLLVRLPASWVGGIGVAIVALHNLADGLKPTAFGALAPLWTALHGPGFLLFSPRVTVLAAYAVLPWLGVMCAGYGLGQVFDWSADRRRTFLLRTGAVTTIAFLALRAVNVYGDPSRWSAQRSPVFTALSFLNTTKYPPSLLFLLMTLGPALMMLGALERGTPRLLRPALVLGRVPMFYFLLHFLIIHLLTVVSALARYGTALFVAESPSLDKYPFTQPPGWAAPLPVIYVVWATVVVLAYPLSRKYAAFKSRRTDPWLSYL